jgi:hypothetical protein
MSDHKGQHAARNILRGTARIFVPDRPRRGGRKALSRAVAEAYPCGPRPRESGAAKSRARRAERRADVRRLYADGWRWIDGGFVLRDADGIARGWTNVRPEWPGLRNICRDTLAALGDR